MNTNRQAWFAVLPAVALVAPGAAVATVYQTIDAAQQALFPRAQFVPHPLAFTPQQMKSIAARARVGGYDKIQRVWEVRSGAQRIGWGSNFPAAAGTLGDLLRQAMEATAALSSAEREWIFSRTAHALYPALPSAHRASANGATSALKDAK